MPYGLKEHIIKEVQGVFSNHSQVEQVILYGSRAKGDYRKSSDIDITLLGEDINLKLVHKIEDELDDLLLPYIFDISIFKNIKNQNLLNHIARVGMDFYLKNSEK